MHACSKAEIPAYYFLEGCEMPIYRFEGKTPKIAASAWVAPTAIVIGAVEIGEKCYIGHGCILRGDYGRIVVGDGTAIEEGAVVHARPNDVTTFGKRVTLGHGAMIHNATIRDDAVIGMRAVVSDFSVVGEWCIIGEMGLVKNGQQVESGKVAVGAPVKIVGEVEDRHKSMWSYAKLLYIDMVRRYKKSFEEIGPEEVDR